MSDQLREALADVSHEIWAHWMRYLFSVAITEPDGAIVLASVAVGALAGMIGGQAVKA